MAKTTNKAEEEKLRCLDDGYLHKDMRRQLYPKHGARFLTTRKNLLNENVLTCFDG